MPELPEVETVRRGLAARDGRRALRAGRAAPAGPALSVSEEFRQAAARARPSTGLGRRAKYLLADLSSGEVLLMHLGMSGSFRVVHGSDEDAPGKFHHVRGKLSAHDHVVFHMSNGAIVTFNDPRRFGYMKLIARDELEPGPDDRRRSGPSRSAMRSTARCWPQPAPARRPASRPRCRTRRSWRASATSMCARRCTARIFRRSASPRPSRTASGAPTARANALADAIKAVLNDAIKAGGSSLRDHRQTDGDLGYFQHSFRVYDRAGEKCPTPGCKGTIKRIVQGTRSTFFCPVCQK